MVGAARWFYNMDRKPLVPHLQNVFTLSRCAALLLFSSILFLAFWVRIQDADRIPPGQFTETDGYSYYKLAQLISDHGTLPDRDMSRWVPLGRDLTKILPFYSYVLAYSQKAIANIFPKISLYQVCIYIPVVCFTLGLGVLMLFFIDRSACSFHASSVCCWQRSRVELIAALSVLVIVTAGVC